MVGNKYSLADIEQSIPQMEFVAGCLLEGQLGELCHLDGLFPAEMSFPDKVLLFSKDRSFYYCRMIELQDSAQSDSVERVRALREIFGFYVNQVLGREKSPAVVDLEQQQLDVANLFSLSHSFLAHAKALRGVERVEDDVLLSQANVTASRQYDRYVQLKKTAREDDCKALQAADTALSDMREAALWVASDRFEFVTMKCGNNDVVLAGANLDLFALLAQESYFWQKNLSENASVAFGEAVKPLRDLDYHADLLKAALERVKVYTERGKGMLELSARVADRVPDVW